jgi:hypothetical protein
MIDWGKVAINAAAILICLALYWALAFSIWELFRQ